MPPGAKETAARPEPRASRRGPVELVLHAVATAAVRLRAGSGSGTLRSVLFLRRALFALGVSGIIAGVLRLRGSGGVPPQRGGWRELTGSDLR